MKRKVYLRILRILAIFQLFGLLISVAFGLNKYLRHLRRHYFWMKNTDKEFVGEQRIKRGHYIEFYYVVMDIDGWLDKKYFIKKIEEEDEKDM